MSVGKVEEGEGLGLARHGTSMRLARLIARTFGHRYSCHRTGTSVGEHLHEDRISVMNVMCVGARVCA